MHCLPFNKIGPRVKRCNYLTHVKMELLSVLRQSLQENVPASTDGRCPSPRRFSETHLNTRAKKQCRCRLLPGVNLGCSILKGYDSRGMRGFFQSKLATYPFSHPIFATYLEHLLGILQDPLGRYRPRAVPDCVIWGRGNGGRIGRRP